MPNTLITPTQVLRETLRILHQKLNFIGNITRDYDDYYAKDGAKVGDTVKLRIPNVYTVTNGAVMTAQDTTETTVSLQISTQKHVGMNFSSNDLTLNIDDFSERYIKPAASVLAANVESDVLSNVYKDVYNQVNNSGSAITFNKVLTARKQLVDNLTPTDDLNVCLATQDNVDLVDTLKGLFQDSNEIKKQYRDGYIGRTGGFDFMENTLLPSHTPGSETAAGTIAINGSNQTGAAITVTNGSSKTLKQGDVITLPGCFRVHPETKVSTGVLQTFVVTADVSSSGTSISISPSVIITGATQNVSAAPTSGSAITKHGTASTAYGLSLAFHREAFAFATADLVMPKGVDFSARSTVDKIAMRIVRQYDINNDKFPCRIDILYGYKTIRAQMASRLANN